MQGDPSILTALNAVLRYHLTAINQAFLHARMGRNWGYKRLDREEYRWSICAMKQADAVIERILFLEGLPNLQDLGKLHIGETVPEILQCDETMLHEGMAVLNQGIALAEEKQDYVSRDLLTEQLEDLQEQLDQVESRRGMIDSMGLPNFLQALIDDDSH